MTAYGQHASITSDVTMPLRMSPYVHSVRWKKCPTVNLEHNYKHQTAMKLQAVM